jgi:hypothetical protein
MSTELTLSRPWPAEPEAASDVMSRLAWYVAVARWAPSKHNTQPWRFVTRGSCLELWPDTNRTLPETDPDWRELVISCGAAMHLACVAARALGYQPQVTLPGRGDGYLARLSETGRWATTDQDKVLLAAVARRRTDRGPLDGLQLPASLPFLLQTSAAREGAHLQLIGTPGDRATLATLVANADRLLVRRAQVDEEIARWLREPGDQRADGVPTANTRGAAASYRAEFVQRDFSSARARPAPERAGADRPILGVLCTPFDRTNDWLTAGRALAAVLLRVTVAGGNASYVNQPVEVPAIRSQLRDQLTLPGVAQLVLRLGTGGEVAPPRRREPADLTVHS